MTHSNASLLFWTSIVTVIVLLVTSAFAYVLFGFLKTGAARIYRINLMKISSSRGFLRDSEPFMYWMTVLFYVAFSLIPLWFTFFAFMNFGDYYLKTRPNT